MYIHLGHRKIVSDKKMIGIFNVNTLLKSEYNDWLLSSIKTDQKTIAINENNEIVMSEVNSITIIQRAGLLNKMDFFWRKKDVKNV